jgi:uncharacterized protein involved in exopolysaccharide biosynthesis
MAQDVTTLNDYLTTFRRRKMLLFGVAFFIMLIFVAVTFSLPAIYRSTGTILIEQQDMPEDLIQSTITSFANERISIVGKRVMSRENLGRIIETFNLYPEERKSTPIEVLVERLRADTLLETVSADVTDSRGRAMSSTIAFNLSYDNESPETAQKVASELAQLYLDENVKSRTESAVQTSSFLAERSEQLETKLKELEGQLADFKERHGNSLPSLATLNRDRLDATEDDLDNVQREIRELTDSRNLLQSELALVPRDAVIYTEEGEPVLSAPERLAALQREYVTLSSKYAANHPDLIQVRKEIELLSGGQSNYSSLGAIDAELLQRKAELESARQKYSSDHPDVVSLTRVVEDLEKRRLEVAAQPAPQSTSLPTNPLFVQKQGQLTSTVNQLAAAQQRLGALEAERAEYERRLTEAPQVERDYTALSRQYDSMLEQYREIQSKQQTAQLSTTLETEEKGERFALIEPPTVPGQPVQPNRMALLILGFVLATGCGIGMAALVEAMDTTVRGAKDVRRLLDMPPLATIPYVENHADVRRRFGRNMLAGGVAVFSIAVVALIIQLAA